NRQDQVRREAAAEYMAAAGARGIRFLCERQPDGRSSALDPGHGTPHRRISEAQDADVQRLRRSGGLAVLGAGPAAELLSAQGPVLSIVAWSGGVARLGSVDGKSQRQPAQRSHQ